VAALGPALRGTPDLSWDELDLTCMAADSPLLALADGWPGRHRRVVVSSPGVCHLARLPDGLDGYLQRLSSRTREEARKLLREANKFGMRLELASDQASIDRFFDQLVTLHKERWTSAGKAGSFAPRHAQFHRTLAHRLVPAGHVVLARLSLNGEPYAVLYAHRVRDKVDMYQIGVPHRTAPVRSPGTTATLLLMARLAADGVVTFDQLDGSNDIKQRYFKDEHRLSRLRVIRPTVRSLVAELADCGRRGLRKVRAAIRHAARPTGRAAADPAVAGGETPGRTPAGPLGPRTGQIH
jgi:CelD/BcsL family acetyltransferase involved in cellulose biosynthesis